jgi:hypothetical protein
MDREREDRLGAVLARASREELLDLAAVVHGLEAPREEWRGLPEEELRGRVRRELGYQGSSSLAFLWRRVTRGTGAAGAAYEEIVDGLAEASRLSAGFVRRVGETLGDHFRAKELLLSMMVAPEGGEGEPPTGRGAELLRRGLRALERGDGAAYRRIVRLAGALAGTALRAGALKGLKGYLGPIGAGALLVGAGRAAYALQGPNAERCLLAVAAVGALRMKYFPLPAEKLGGLERLVESMGRECRECGRPIARPEEACLVCWVGLHEGCGSRVERLDTGASGRACGECRRRDLEGDGILIPDPGTLSPADWLRAAGYRAHVLTQRLERAAGEIQASIRSLGENAHQLRRDLAEDLRRTVRGAFGYLYVMFFTTVFLTLFGIAYFKTSGMAPPGDFNPASFFRLSSVVMVGVPAGVWLAGALLRAARNARREDYERRPDGRRLSLRDYLFGFLYYDNPVENVWGPIALIGTTLAALMWIFLGR